VNLRPCRCGLDFKPAAPGSRRCPACLEKWRAQPKTRSGQRRAAIRAELKKATLGEAHDVDLVFAQPITGDPLAFEPKTGFALKPLAAQKAASLPRIVGGEVASF
jgi:hypothetical protein